MSRKVNCLWGYSYFSNDTRTFLFKIYNNTLGLNNRVAHFIRDHSPICTFCRIRLRNDAPNEDTLHLFYDCPSTESIRDEFFRWAYCEEKNYTISRADLFLVQVSDINNSVNSTTIVKTVLAKLFLKYIWDCRNRYCLPTVIGCRENIVAEFKTVTSVSKKMNEHFNDSGLANNLLQG
jgi:hypothetical protein